MEQNRFSSRPLAPRLRELRPAGAGATQAANAPQLSTSTSQGPLIRPKKNSKAACDSCRSRKAKCSADRPKCAHCRLKNLKCVYSTNTANETPSQALKRKYAELKRDKTPYEELYELLRTASPTEALQVLQRIRDGTDVQALLRQVKDGDLLLQLAVAPETRYRYKLPFIDAMPALLQSPRNAYLKTLLFQWDQTAPPGLLPASNTTADAANERQSVYLKPYHAAELVDAKLDSIKPSAWTTVSSDDDYMRRLMKTYFLWEYHTNPSFQKDIFLEDMLAGRETYCSSLLVNAILALACLSDRANPYRAEFWNPRNVAYQFLAETRRLWDLEARNARLTTIQATLIIQIITNLNGADQVGYGYFTQAVEMADSIDLFRVSGIEDKTERNARGFTAWILYYWSGLVGYLHQRRPLCERAPDIPLPDPSAMSEWYGDLCFKYPSSSALFHDHFHVFINSKVKLWLIARDMASQIYKHDGIRSELSVHQVLDYCARLRSWFNMLPQALSPRKIATPYQLQLHMQYHTFMIQLLEEPILSSLETPENIVSASHVLGQERPRVVLETSRNSLETLIRLYYLRHGFEFLDSLSVQHLSMLAFMTFKRIQDGQEPDVLQSLQSSIVLATSALRNQSHSYYLGRMVFSAVRGSMGAEEVRLIDQFAGQGHVRDHHPPPDWRALSFWNIDFRSISQDRQTSNLAKLFEKARLNELNGPVKT